MITQFQSYIRQRQHTLRRWMLDPTFHASLRICACLLTGLFLSAASLGQYLQPFTLGLVCAASGWPSALFTLGGSAGYLLFWGSAGTQGAVWLLCGLVLSLALGQQLLVKTHPFLLSAAAGVLVAVTGLVFQIAYNDTTPILMYLLRIALGFGSCWLFQLLQNRRSTIAPWFAWGLCVLTLSQIVPFPWLCLGFVAAGALSTAGTFPAAALGGLALDLAQVCPVPMTAVISLAYFARMLPGLRKPLLYLAPALVYLLVMGLCGLWDLLPLPALALGGFLGRFLPGQTQLSHRRGETGIAQVRLEMVAGVFSQMQILMLEAEPSPVDEGALILLAAQRVCSTCPCRKSCRDREKIQLLDPAILHTPLVNGQTLPVSCRKEGRVMQELLRTQAQYRAILADRQRQKEYRYALIQQYHFLSSYLQDLSDELSRRVDSLVVRYKPQVSFCANRPEADNGDRCLCFTGTGCRYYVLLCDGMGTGLGAIEEGRTAAALLKKLLLAGVPASYALRSLNSLFALRGRAGASTIDLAELQLDTGTGFLYKWGAPASYIISRAGVEKIGTAGPPPGLSVTEAQETVERLSLRRGETLVLCSDGVDGEDVLRCGYVASERPLGELAAEILESGGGSDDDATLAVLRLVPDSLPVS